MLRICRIAVTILVVLAFTLPMFAADGPALFKSKCVGCHAADGNGSPIGKKLGAKSLGSAEVQKLTDADIEKVITTGKGKMTAFKTLTPEEVRALVAAVRTFKK